MANKHAKNCSTSLIKEVQKTKQKNNPEKPFHIYQNYQIPPKPIISNAGEDMEQLELSYTVGGSTKMVQSLD